MNYVQAARERQRDINNKRQIWRAFFMLTEAVDPESFLIQLKNKGLVIERGQVYNTLTLLTDYGFADRTRHDGLGLTLYKCR